MSFNSAYVTSLHGRRIGLAAGTTNITGSGTAGRNVDLLVGPEALRTYVSTNESTANTLPAYGLSVLTTAPSSGVFVLDPPIPGVRKSLYFDSTNTNTMYVRTLNSEVIESTVMTSATVISSSQGANIILELMGVTTAVWVAVSVVSTGSLKMSTTT